MSHAQSTKRLGEYTVGRCAGLLCGIMLAR
jgi:hypothetical protein